jgi:hypothetical protein
MTQSTLSPDTDSPSTLNDESADDDNEDDFGINNTMGSWSRQATLTLGPSSGQKDEWGRQVTWESLGFNSRQVTEEFCPKSFQGLQEQNELVTIRNGFVDLEEHSGLTMSKSASSPALLGDCEVPDKFGDDKFGDTSLRRFESARPSASA